LGVMFGLSPWIGVAVAATWLFVAKVMKISSLSALIAAVLAPFYVYWLSGEMSWVWGSGLMSALLIWRHRSNIQRLIKGEEDLIQR